MTIAHSPDIRRLHERRDTDELIVDAHTVLEACGLHMSAAKVIRLVRAYRSRVERNGWAFFEFLATAVQLSAQRRAQALLDPDIARVIGYADPTGETAVRHIMEGTR